MKFKILGISLLILLFMNCGQKFDAVQAEDVIKKTLELSEKDILEIVGISKESKEVVLVKFKLNEIQISSKMRKYDTGGQLEEVQNEVGMWIPAETLSKSYGQKENLKATMKSIGMISGAIADYVVDNGIAPSQEGFIIENSSFYNALCPFYIKSLPIMDSWGNKFMVYCGETVNGHYGISEAKSDDFLVVSYGRDGKQELWEINLDDTKAGLYAIDDIDDYNKDIVSWNGAWIRGPRKEELKKK